MAPLTTTTGAARSGTAFASINGSRPAPRNAPEIIEIDDDSDPADEADTDHDADGDDGEEVVYGDENGEGDDDNDTADSDYTSSAQVNGTESVFDDTSLYSKTNGRDRDTPELFTSAGARHALRPLRKTADRVTRRIEAFAEKLDQFKQKEARADQFHKIQAAWALVKSYRTMADDAIKDLSKQNILKRAKAGWDTTRTNGNAVSTGPEDLDTDDQRKRLQLESDTWYLFENLISIDDPASRAHEKQAQETAFQRLHRYSSDREVWDTFIDADHYARECLVILKWLEHTAQTAGDDLDVLISDLESQAERGRGLWSHGWLYTKESIKGQKRLRGLPKPLEAEEGGITLSLITSEKHEPLITQLDPDAIIRQKQSLQKQDQFYERATWLTCWKMLRQGRTWTEIREWSHQRLENWRAVSLCGTSVEPCAKADRVPADESITRMMNFRSQATWRAACSALARNSNTDEFERAVYALLCGETEPAYKVCHTWDDYLYVFFNSLLLSRYQGFCKQLQRKLTHSPTSPVRFAPESPANDAVRQFLEQSRANDRFEIEAQNPYRVVQSAILSKTYDSFFITLSDAVAKVNSPETNGAGRSADHPMLNAAQDADALRIAAHLYIIAISLGLIRTDAEYHETAALCLLGYIAELEARGLYEQIVLYASLLPTDRAETALAQVLLEIVDPNERQRLVKTLKKHHINIEAVLDKQWDQVYSEDSEPDHVRDIRKFPKMARFDDKVSELLPVRKDFIGADVSPRDDRLIRNLEWRRCVDGQWDKICHLGTTIYRDFYMAGKLASARELMKRMSLSDVSREAFGIDVSEVVDANGTIPTPRGVPDRARAKVGHSRSSSHEIFSNDHQSVPYQQSQTMRDFEQLINAFEALENFAIHWDEFDETHGKQKASAVNELKQQIAEAVDDVLLSVEPMLGKWLMPTGDKALDADLQQIKLTYLPEIVLEYHSALYYAAHAVSSELLLECLSLATKVSSTPNLTDTFVNAQRMAELVDVLALSSRAIVNVQSKNKKKVLPGGATLAIWDVDVEADKDDEQLAQAYAHGRS